MTVSEIRTGLRSPQIWGFALLAAVGPWISILFPRVMASVLPLITLIAIGGLWMAQRRLPRMAPLPWIFAGLATLLGGLSAFWGPEPSFILNSTARMAGAFIGGILLFYAAGELREEQRQLLRVLLIGGFLFALAFICLNAVTDSALIASFLTEHDAADLDARDNRAMVVLSLMLWPVIFAAQCFLPLQPNQRRAVLLLMPLTLLVSLLTNSQTSGAAVLLGSLLYLFARAYPSLANRLVAFGGAFLILTLPCLVLLLKHFDPSISFNWQEASSGARIEIWYAVAGRIMEAPWLGHGMDAARDVADWGMAHLYYPFDKILHPHNGMLQIWYEFGMLGAVFAATAWLAVTRRIGDAPVREVAMSLTLLSAMVLISSISHGLWQSWWLGAVGLMPALVRMVRQD